MRRLGIEPLPAHTMLSWHQPTGQGFAELPPRPANDNLARSSEQLELPPSNAGVRKLHVIGDTGGIADPNPQKAVAAAMVADLTAHPDIACAWHLGDVGYFEGSQEAYEHQLFEAYDSYLRHLIGIPGNHDGAGDDQLKWWSTYFCDSKPQLRAEVEEFHRDTMTQPYAYWMWEDELLTMIGLYSNVPSGGVIKDDQAQWLAPALAAAPKDRALLLSVHHPPLSADGHHGGSAVMGEVLDKAFEASKRCPDLVLSGHVHSYQRFSRTYWGRQVPYVVCGAGGYHNLHAMAPGAAKGLQLTPEVRLEDFCDSQWGFLTLHVAKDTIVGEYTAVDKGGASTPFDRWSVPVTRFG